MKRSLFLIIILFSINTSSSKAQSIACLDLAGLDFGECTMVLGYAIIDGSCILLSGCSTEIDGYDYQEFIFETPAECETACSYTCMDLNYLDFGPCDAIIGYGMIDGLCTEISGCSPIINGFDFSPYYSSSIEDCQLACSPICMDLAEIDFGECTMPLGIAIIDGQCISLSGCGYEVNGIDYENYFFDNLTDCENACIPTYEPCIIPEIIDSSAGCLEVYDPVCGCDGETYSNSCFARMYGGVAYWTQGVCVTGIIENTLRSINVYPNPATDLLKIENPDFEELSVQIIDMTGKIIFSTQINSFTSVDISYIKQGIYLLQLNNSNGISTVKKLIIH